MDNNRSNEDNRYVLLNAFGLMASQLKEELDSMIKPSETIRETGELLDSNKQGKEDESRKT